jgi:hypothetical protein
MSDAQMWLSGASWLLPLAAVIVWLLYRKGFLSRRAFRDAPDRDVPVTPVDLLPAFALLLAGTLVADALVTQGLGFTRDESGAFAGSGQNASAILIYQLLYMGLPAAWFVFRSSRGEAGLRRSGLLPRRPMRDLKWGVTALLAAIPLVMAATLIVSGIALLLDRETPMIGHRMLEQMRAEESLAPLMIMLVSAVVVAPLLEEVVFRGLVQTSLLSALGKERRWLIVALASILFAVTHLGAAIWQSLAALTVLSLILGFLYERTGSLWPSILCHAGFNAWNVAIVLSGVLETQAGGGGTQPGP